MYKYWFASAHDNLNIAAKMVVANTPLDEELQCTDFLYLWHDEEV